MAKFEIYQDKNDKWMFRFKAPNGQVMFTGQKYCTLNSILTAIDTIKQYVGEAPVKQVED